MHFQSEGNLQEPEVISAENQPAEPAESPAPETGQEAAKNEAPRSEVSKNALPARARNANENSHGFTPEEQAVWEKTNSYTEAWQLMMARRNREWEEGLRQKWSASHAGRLLTQLGQTYMAYKNYLERSPQVAESALRFDEVNQRIFERLRTNVEKANNAPRCARIMAGGRRCRAPRMRGKQFCHMHLAMEEARPQKVRLPSLEDANSIQLAIAKAAQALVDGQLDQKQAGMLGYYLQIAASNVGRLDFEEEEEEGG